MEKREDMLDDPKEKMWEMGNAFNKFAYPFDAQKYEKEFAENYSVLLSSSRKQIPSAQSQKPEVFYFV